MKKSDVMVVALSITLALGVVVLGVPALTLPWSLLDDGIMLAYCPRFGSVLKPLQFLENVLVVGRETVTFRPWYWVYRSVLYQLGGPRPLYFHLANLILFLATVQAVFWLMRWHARSSFTAFGTAVAFMVFYPQGLIQSALANWYRLGVPDPQVVSALGMSLLCMYGARQLIVRSTHRQWAIALCTVLGVVLLVPAYFSKETTVVMIPVSAVMVLCAGWGLDEQAARKFRSLLLVYFLANIVIGAMEFFLKQHFSPRFMEPGTYLAEYELTVKNVAGGVRDYGRMLYDQLGLLLVICPLSFLILLWRTFGSREPKSKATAFGLVMVLLAALSLLVLLPWRHHQSRYLLTFGLAFLCVVGLEVERLVYWIWGRLSRPRAARLGERLFAAVLGLLLFYGGAHYALFSAVGLVNFVPTVPELERANADFVGFLHREGGGRIVYWDVPVGEELFGEAELLLKHVYGNPAIEMRYLEWNKAQVLEQGDWLLAYTDLPTGTVAEKYRQQIRGNLALKQEFVSRITYVTYHEPLGVMLAIHGERGNRVWQTRTVPQFGWKIFAVTSEQAMSALAAEEEGVKALVREIAAQPHAEKLVNELIDACRSLGSYHAARRELQGLRTQTPLQPSLLWLSAYLAYLDKDYVGARAGLHELLALDPGNWDALWLTGRMAVKESRVAEALPLLEHTLATTPTASLANLAGELQQLAGRTQAADAAFQMAISLNAESPEAFFNVAMLHLDAGNSDEALRWYRKAKELVGRESTGEYVSMFASPEELKEWKPEGTIQETRITDTAAELKCIGTEASLTLRVALEASRRHVIIVKMAAQLAEARVRIGWTTASDPRFDNAKSMQARVASSMGAQRYFFFVGDSPAWSDRITSLRLEPLDRPGTVYLYYVAVMRY